MNDLRIPIRGDKDILKAAQKSRHVTQDVIAEKLNVKRNALCQSMNRSRMSLGMFSKILDVLDYDVLIADRSTGEVVWQLYVEREEDDDDI